MGYSWIRFYSIYHLIQINKPVRVSRTGFLFSGGWEIDMIAP